jgi:L-2-hydroxyglutarate oxidase LhgO
VEKVDCVIVGAGVVGLAIARELAATGRETIVIEAEASFGMGTSSRNSEVIHSGIYYPEGSLKAQLCVQGRGQLYAYAQSKNIVHNRVGKVIIAVTEQEIPSLRQYARLSTAAGAGQLQSLTPTEVAELEPEVVCVGGLLSPSTGTIDSHELMLNLVADLEADGGIIAYRTRFLAAKSNGKRISVMLEGDQAMELECTLLVNSAGLNAQTVAESINGMPSAFIPRGHYAIGHYYALTGRSPFKRLVYPIAGSGGLGVHVTLDSSGQARFGPDVRWIDRIDYEFDDSGRNNFIDAIRRYYPGIVDREIVPAYTGIRPKVAGPGEAAADFVIQGPDNHGVRGVINLFGIESPGLTSALAIGNYVVTLAQRCKVF